MATPGVLSVFHEWAPSIYINLRSRMSACCSPPRTFSITPMTCTSSRTIELQHGGGRSGPRVDAPSCASAQITMSKGMLFQLRGAYFQARDLQSACVILRVRVAQSMHRVRTSREGRGGDHNADALACQAFGSISIISYCLFNGITVLGVTQPNSMIIRMVCSGSLCDMR